VVTAVVVPELEELEPVPALVELEPVPALVELELDPELPELDVELVDGLLVAAALFLASAGSWPDTS
jgi:hypothetical protein